MLVNLIARQLKKIYINTMCTLIVVWSTWYISNSNVGQNLLSMKSCMSYSVLLKAAYVKMVKKYEIKHRSHKKSTHDNIY